MRKLLFLSHSFLIIIVSFLLGCSAPTNNPFKPKSYNDYYNSLENTTIEMELVIDNKRAICFYTNDTEIYVFTIKYQYSGEFGYIYNTTKNELYDIENRTIKEKKINIDAENAISKLYNSNNVLFHLNLITQNLNISILLLYVTGNVINTASLMN